MKRGGKKGDSIEEMWKKKREELEKSRKKGRERKYLKEVRIRRDHRKKE